jgi:rubredoxin
MLIHICQLCGYEYNPRKGDPENDIEPFTDFEDLPADWVCPLCGAGKEDFSEEYRDGEDEEIDD